MKRYQPLIDRCVRQCALFLILLILVPLCWFVFKTAEYLLPLVVVCAVQLWRCGVLLRLLYAGGYKIIPCTVAEVTKSKRNGYLLVELEGVKERLRLPRRNYRVSIGDRLELFLRDDSPVYDKGGVYHVPEYILLCRR